MSSNTVLPIGGQPIRKVPGIEVATDSLGQLFDLRASLSANEVGFRFNEQKFTYSEMRGMVDRIRGSLRREGAEPGSRIAVFMYNSPWLLAIFLACAVDRLVYCPINVASRRDDLSYFLADIEPSAIFVDVELADVFQAANLVGVTSRRYLVGEQPHKAGLIRFDAWLEQQQPLQLTGSDAKASDPALHHVQRRDNRLA